MYKLAFVNVSIDKYDDLNIWEGSIWVSSFFDMFARNKNPGLLPKIQLMILAALTPDDFDVRGYDEDIQDVDFETLDADLVAITGMSVHSERIYQVSEILMKRGIKVIIGGIHASVLPDQTLEHCDAICVGEGENVWPAMLDDFRAGKLQRRYDSKDYPPVTELVSPRLDVFDMSKYSAFPIMATKGCPYSCEFCSIEHSSGHRHRKKPVEQVVAEIKEMEKLNVRTAAPRKRYIFVDENLYVHRKYTKELFTALIGLGIQWQGEGTLNTAMDDEILDLMARAGCRTFSIGFESVNEASLQEANKKQNSIELYHEAIQNIARHGIRPGGFFIFGFDSDGIDVFERTAEFISNEKLHLPLLSILTPYPGTRLYDKIKDRIFDHDLRRYGNMACVFTPAKMTPWQLENGLYWSIRQIYSLENIKAALEDFWSRGPWPYYPRLTLYERLTLIYMWLRSKKKYPEHAEFLRWAAFNPNAIDLVSIFTALGSYDNRDQYAQIDPQTGKRLEPVLPSTTA